MIDYIVTYKLNNEINDKVFTIEDDVIFETNKNNKDQDVEFEREELIKDIVLELLKEKFGKSVELIDFETVVDNNFDIYKLTY